MKPRDILTMFQGQVDEIILSIEVKQHQTQADEEEHVMR